MTDWSVLSRPRIVVLALWGAALLGACAMARAPHVDNAQVTRAKIAHEKFEEHCKSAGEKITRTVEGVEGVFLLKLRPQGINFARQFDMDDPYGDDSTGDRYIESFLAEKIRPKQPLIAGAPPSNGYRYIDTQGDDGKRYRYTGAWKDVLKHGRVMDGDQGRQWYSREFVLDKTLATSPAPRYGVTYDDISTHEDREYWIAGSSLRVIDLQTNEVIAERIGYMWDPGQGNNGGGRSPWLMAASYACPGFQFNPFVPPDGHMFARQQQQTQVFTEKVLRPILDK